MTVLGLLISLNIMVGFIMIHLWFTSGYENRILDIKELLQSIYKSSDETNRNIKDMHALMEQKRRREYQQG